MPESLLGQNSNGLPKNRTLFNKMKNSGWKLFLVFNALSRFLFQFYLIVLGFVDLLKATEFAKGVVYIRFDFSGKYMKEWLLHIRIYDEKFFHLESYRIYIIRGEFTLYYTYIYTLAYEAVYYCASN